MATSSVPAQWGSLLLGAALLLTGLLVGACDQMTGSAPGDAGAPLAADSAALRHSPMPTGTSLPSPGEVPLRNGTVEGRADSPRPKSDSSGAESPYGCYLASRPYTEAVKFRSVYLYFPEEMIEEAGENTKRLTFRLEAVRGGHTDTTGVRYAHCVIPEAEGAQEAARRQVVRPREKAALREAVLFSGGAGGSPTAKSCEIEATACTCVGPFQGSVSCECTEFEVSCSGGDGGGDNTGDGGSGGGATDPYPDDDGGGSGSDGECTSIINPEPGSDCEPAEPDPCESANPPDYCDEAGSCYDKNIGNNEHDAILTGLEEDGALNESWQRSENLGDNIESGQWIIRDPNTDAYSAQKPDPGMVSQTACAVLFDPDVTPPENAVGFLHTQPSDVGDTVTCPADPRNPTGPQVTFEYDGTISDFDSNTLKEFGLSTGVMIDGSNVHVFGQNDRSGSASQYSRCGY